VRIRSTDRGQIGLDLGYTDEQGPCLIKNVTVEGFDIGIRTLHVVNSVTFEDIVLRNQSRFGLYNRGQCISIRRLDFLGSVPAIQIEQANSVVALDQVRARGAGNARDVAAIVNDGGYLYARDIQTSGFRQAIDTGAGDPESGALPSPRGNAVADFSSRDPGRDRLFPSPDVHIRLNVPETPESPRIPLSQWVSPADFGGRPGPDIDNTEAIQRAIDSGRRVLYFPPGDWSFNGEVVVRGNIEVVTALEGALRGSGTLRFADGAAARVHFERTNLLYTNVKVIWDARRPLIISGVTFGNGLLELRGQGDVFLEDVVMGRLEVQPNQRVWARQLNIEWKGDQHPDRPEKLDNNGGQIWVLGYKTEMAGSVCRTRNGGTTVIFGGMIYAQGAPKEQPMLIVEDASLSATLGETCWNFGRQGFHVLARETRNGSTKELPGGSQQGRYWRANNASAVPLYSAYRP
jgi:large repetitive protein